MTTVRGRREVTAGLAVLLALVVATVGFGFMVSRSHELARAAAGTGRPRSTGPNSVAQVATAPTAPVGVVEQIGEPPPRLRSLGGPAGSVSATTSPAVALTFDDGPSPLWTPRVLDVLRRTGVRATFCLIGSNAARYPQLVRDIVAGGHTLCNHSWNHNLYLGRRGADDIRADLLRASAAIHAAAPGAPIPYFRQPGGLWTSSLVSVARDLGMTPLNWAVDPQDWRRPPARQIEDTVTRGCQPGNIILMHDGGGDRSHTYQALVDMLPRLVLTHRFIALPSIGI